MGTVTLRVVEGEDHERTETEGGEAAMATKPGKLWAAQEPEVTGGYR